MYKKDSSGYTLKFLEWKLRRFEIVMFSKSYSPEGQECDRMIQSCKGVTEDNYECVCYEKRGDLVAIDNYLWKLSGHASRQCPHLFIRGDYFGGYRKLLQTHTSGKLQRIISNLPNIPPGSKNYIDNDKSWNLVHQADPNFLPGTVLKYIADADTPHTAIKILDWEAEGRENADYKLIAGRRIAKPKHSVRSSADKRDPTRLNVAPAQADKFSK